VNLGESRTIKIRSANRITREREREERERKKERELLVKLR